MTHPPDAPTAVRPADTGAIPWYRRISLKMAAALGLAMFAIQLLTSTLILWNYRSRLDDIDYRGTLIQPFARYVSDNLTVSATGQWMPTEEAIRVVENFLGPGEHFVWLDPLNRVVTSGRGTVDIAAIGEVWPLCESPAYCEITDDGGEPIAGSTWSQMQVSGRQIGKLVLVWFEDTKLGLTVSQHNVRDLSYRLIASAAVAALTSILLVSVVTRRLSRLATEASAPLDERVENVDLPGPFDDSGDDEIARLAKALNTMRGRIELLVDHMAERDRQRREWIAQVSHDLRTPLTALSACLDRAREKMLEHDDLRNRSDILEAINVAHQDGDRLQTLVDDLFELARLDANEDLMLEPVPPGELVRQSVRGLEPMAEAQSVELTSQVAPSLPTIRADGRRLMRALENMVRNAVHYAASTVQVIARAEDGWLHLEVRDDGPGLPQQNGKIILGQTDDRPRRPDSAGLGLIVTRRVATAHGGTLQGCNPPEGGACVWITIPIIEAH